MRQMWHDAAASYFDPSRFQLNVQNCIVISRTTTFILQSNKHEIEGFDEWYTPYQERWRNDPIMNWAKEARNTIEKRGDLETYSQVRAKIIAAYLDGPETNWLSDGLLASPQKIFQAVPKKFLIPHIVENGTLLIERRWVDSGLPDTEVLEALAYVYSEFADMVVSLLKFVKITVPTSVSKTKPDAMGALAMDRAIYLSMKDGSLRGYRYFEKSLEHSDAKWRRKIASRYGMIQLNQLKAARTFRAVVEAYFDIARMVMLRDGFHKSLTFFLKGHEVIRVISSEFPDRASKYVLTRDLARLARIDGADGVLMIGEAWTAHGDGIPKSGFAADAKNRGEALTMSAGNSQGELFMLSAAVERKKIKSQKVKRFGQTLFEDRGYPLMLYPFMKEWGCVDDEKLAKSLARIDSFGIETPHIDG
jgi:hypothetical protein